ncbi:MAG TPA: NAD(P)-dependent oxidoreductase [Stellaceae bacterium]|nr:NAD(P)-dependent oxidoreductase [Stellaceae bacterium]
MATLVIGAGLIGSQVARLLVEQGERPVLLDTAFQRDALGEIVDLAQVRLVEGNVLRPLALVEIARASDVTEIVHTAANPMLTTGAQRDPFAAIELNIMGTVNVLETARVLGLKRVVVSSSNVLSHYLAGGEGKGDLAKEEALPRPVTFYATTKQAIENLGLNYARWCGVDFAAVRYGAVAGPWSGRGGGGPSNVFRDAVLNALAGTEAVVPASAMEWVYAKDAAAGTVLALKAGSLSHRVFNITMGTLTPPQAFASALQKAVPGARVRIADPPADARSLMNMTHGSDLAVSRAELGYAPRFDIDAAVADMVAWYRSNERTRKV